jgi:hypothetical protein
LENSSSGKIFSTLMCKCLMQVSKRRFVHECWLAGRESLHEWKSHCFASYKHKLELGAVGKDHIRQTRQLVLIDIPIATVRLHVN